jgi:hypothetical protein
MLLHHILKNLRHPEVEYFSKVLLSYKILGSCGEWIIVALISKFQLPPRWELKRFCSRMTLLYVSFYENEMQSICEHKCMDMK